MKKICPERKKALKLLKRLKDWFTYFEESEGMTDVGAPTPTMVEFEELIRSHNCLRKK